MMIKWERRSTTKEQNTLRMENSSVSVFQNISWKRNFHSSAKKLRKSSPISFQSLIKTMLREFFQDQDSAPLNTHWAMITGLTSGSSCLISLSENCQSRISTLDPLSCTSTWHGSCSDSTEKVSQLETQSSCRESKDISSHCSTTQTSTGGQLEELFHQSQSDHLTRSTGDWDRLQSSINITDVFIDTDTESQDIFLGTVPETSQSCHTSSTVEQVSSTEPTERIQIALQLSNDHIELQFQ